MVVCMILHIYIDTLHLQMFTIIIASIFSFLNNLLLETQNLSMPHNTIQGNLQCSSVCIFIYIFVFLQILP